MSENTPKLSPAAKRADGSFIYFDLDGLLDAEPTMWLATVPESVDGAPSVTHRTETRVPLTEEQASRVREWLK